MHDLDPFVIELMDGIGLRWYGTAYLAGFALGFYLLRRITKHGHTPLSAPRVGDLVIAVALGAVIGGRVGYVLLYEPLLLGLYREAGALAFPYWGMLAVHRGGMASHGGMIGALIGALVFCRQNKPEPIPIMHGFDLVAFGAPFGLMFGRIANFIGGELVGRPVNEGFPLAVRFPQEIVDWSPEQIRELELRYAMGSNGLPLPLDLPEAVRRGDTALIDALTVMLPARHPSQLYAAALEGLVVGLILLWVYRKPVKPGLAAGVFGIAYGIARIINEFFRRPDLHLMDEEFMATREAIGVGVSRGQWLSLILIGIGVALIVTAKKRDSPKLGGWLRG